MRRLGLRHDDLHVAFSYKDGEDKWFADLLTKIKHRSKKPSIYSKVNRLLFPDLDYTVNGWKEF